MVSVADGSRVKLSCVQHGADPSKKNRDGNMPLDMVKDGDTDIQDLLRGDAALLDAAKKGCLARVQKLCSPENINCRDTQGRNSTPLHLAGNRRLNSSFSPHRTQTNLLPRYLIHNKIHRNVLFSISIAPTVSHSVLVQTNLQSIELKALQLFFV